jgi:hypothetical protein
VVLKGVICNYQPSSARGYFRLTNRLSGRVICKQDCIHHVHTGRDEMLSCFGLKMYCTKISYWGKFPHALDNEIAKKLDKVVKKCSCQFVLLIVTYWSLSGTFLLFFFNVNVRVVITDCSWVILSRVAECCC